MTFVNLYEEVDCLILGRFFLSVYALIVWRTLLVGSIPEEN